MNLRRSVPYLLGLTTAAVFVVVAGLGVRKSVRAVVQDDSIREGPRILQPGKAGLGELIAGVSFTDLDGKSGKLTDFRGHKATVFCMTGAGCPVAKKYGPTLVELQKKYRARSVDFILVNPDAHAEPATVRAAFDGLKSAGFTGRYVHDTSGDLTRRLGATSSTEAFVLDAALTLIYRGAINDQYGLAYALPQARNHFLTEALDAVLAGKSPVVSATSAPGCVLAHEEKDATSSTGVTFNNRISRILQRNCQECHRPGEAAPFSLLSYGDAKDHLGMMKKVITKGTMPPWFADPKYGHWANDRTLPERDKSDLLAWIGGGAPVGDPADAPLARTFISGWEIGKPDAVYSATSPVHVPAVGPIPYRTVFVPTRLTEDKWVQAVEVRTPAPQVVHHLLVFVVYPPGDDRVKDQPDVKMGVGGYFAALLPGQGGVTYPQGMAKLLPKGAVLRLQIHYTPDGTAVDDVPKVGFIFAPKPPEHELITQAASTTKFRIPPGVENYEVTANYNFKGPVNLISFSPHSHLRGKAYRYELLMPGGGVETLLDVPRYDFNWQLEYKFAEPLEVPAGATLRVHTWFDNSSKNPANPDPTKTVRFGEQTTDEMMIGYFTASRKR